ncbi:hypothetical protein Gogos_009984, partial [Gossypium gossypioides]|nr:hypothetical protein [Gossypium gossypioides]
MVCFLLPKTLCNELESIMAKFWWQKGFGKKGIHWCTWDHLSEPKEIGGVGFRSLAKFNVALLAKEGLGNLPSYTWKSVWAARVLLENEFCWSVGSGSNISIKGDDWLSGSPNYRINEQVGGLNLVSGFIDVGTREWKVNLINSTFSEEIASKILRNPLAWEGIEDIRVWRGESSREFSVRSAYKLLHKDLNDEDWFTWIFRMSSSDQCRFFCCAIWGIWAHRNLVLHEGSQIKGKEITDWITRYIGEIDNLEDKKFTRYVVHEEWCPPLGSDVKVNFMWLIIKVWRDLDLEWLFVNLEIMGEENEGIRLTKELGFGERNEQQMVLILEGCWFLET